MPTELMSIISSSSISGSSGSSGREGTVSSLICGSVVSVKKEDIPNYVDDIVTHILSTGDINKYLGDKTIDNQFTRIGKKENG